MNLPKADISLITGMADYPALIMHRSYEGDADRYRPESLILVQPWTVSQRRLLLVR